jgi:hypothetical protein
VDYSSLEMHELGRPGMSEEGKPQGKIYSVAIPYVEWKNIGSGIDKIWRERVKKSGCYKNKEFEVSKYLKAIDKIIANSKYKDFCFLFRKNTFFGIDINDFKGQLNSFYRQKNIVCSTVHKYKGAQSKVVVIMEVNRGVYPKIHPDNELMEIFGVTLAKVIEEERHLFYVASTRAENELYFLYDEVIGRTDFMPNDWQYSSLDFSK